jgi:DNA-binding PadR family transcriptional regulator
MLVLAAVRLMQPVHGYDLRRELLSWRADEWANVQPGSVYGALKTLARDGLIAVGGVAQHGARPERTQYHMTPEGEKELANMLRQALWAVDQVKHPYYPIVSMFPFLPRDEVMGALRARILKFEAELDRYKYESKRILSGNGDPARGGIPYHVFDVMRLGVLYAEADLRWSQETLQRIETGELDVWPKVKPD